MKTIPTDKSEAYYQLALSHVDGIGPKTVKKLVRHFGSAEEVFRTAPSDLMDVTGLKAARASAIAAFSDFGPIDAEMEFADMHGIDVLSFTDSRYPNRLRHCEDGPTILFVKGSANLSADRMISIVGTRRITGYGKSMTRRLVEELGPHGVTVVSGLAYGVDIEAHRACLRAGLPTIAVLGHGLREVYPLSHTRYAEEIAETGALISEFMADTRPDRENFPRRNRVVAGMCDATVVVESRQRGGSMITADLAAGYNRDVFAVPGRIDDPHSEGCNRLIKTGAATLLESPQDILRSMGWMPAPNGKGKKSIQRKIFVDLTPEEEKILAILRNKMRLQIDELGLLGEMPTSEVLVHLLNLELNGLVRSLPGKLYEPC